MAQKENLHEGHRKRLREKYEQGKEFLKEHELLEMLLTYSIARKDTNALAHKLINKFGSLNEVLNVSTKELTSVDGVGEHTANLLSLVGYIGALKQNPLEKTKLNNIDSVKKLGVELFKGLDHEVLYVFYLDSQKRILGSTMLDDGSVDSVSLNYNEISNAILRCKPKSAIVLHNHFSKYPEPSEADDLATAKLITFLNYNKVTLFDHVIVSGEEIYSYFYDNRIQKIKEYIKNKTI